MTGQWRISTDMQWPTFQVSHHQHHIRRSRLPRQSCQCGAQLAHILEVDPKMSKYLAAYTWKRPADVNPSSDVWAIGEYQRMVLARMVDLIMLGDVYQRK